MDGRSRTSAALIANGARHVGGGTIRAMPYLQAQVRAAAEREPVGEWMARRGPSGRIRIGASALLDNGTDAAHVADRVQRSGGQAVVRRGVHQICERKA